MFKKIGIFVFILALFALAPVSVLALGQMTQPINITDAMRGQKINQELIVVNNEKTQIGVVFTASGQIKDWVKFYTPGDLQNPVATTTAEAGKNLNMIAVFSVPNDAPNGVYKGAVSVSNLPGLYAPKDQSSASLTQKIDRQVTISISAAENIKLDVSVIPETYDIGLNQPLSVRIIYDNQSNVSLTPSISFKIKTNDDKAATVYNVIYPYPDGVAAVNAKGNFEIPALKIPTSGIAKGEYLAQLQFLRGDTVLSEKQFAFSIGTQGAAIASKMGGSSIWGIGILVLIILVIAGWFYKKNMSSKQDLKKEFRNLKKKYTKAFKLVKTGISGMF
jgi:hypothetical protein